MKKLFYGFIALGLTSLPTTAFAATLSNPLGTNNIQAVIGRIIQAILGVTGSIALLMFIYGGFLWLIAGGSSDRIEKGKKTLIWSTLGLIVIVGAYTLTRTLIVALESGTVE